tara:strand:- start:769 stop:1671 length:903 start_codon:yes stop_codon:yes gene_type:complete
MVKNNFILGVGAQKAGTTFLFGGIRQSKSMFSKCPKEMNILDNLHSDLKQNKIENIEKELKKTNLSKESSFQLKRRRDFIKNPERYFDFFADKASEKGITHVGEFTPSYSSLNQEQLKYIRDNLKARNFEIKIIFMLRDPFERISSMCRMGIKRRFKKNHKNLEELLIKDPYYLKKFISQEQFEEKLKLTYSKEWNKKRTCYEKTIENLENIFAHDEIFIDFFEDMFNDKFKQKISRFLELHDIILESNEIRNITPKFEPIKESLKSEIINYYKNTYLYIKQKYPLKAINLWKASYEILN